MSGSCRHPSTAALLPLVLVLTLAWGTTWPLFPYAVREVSVWTFRAVSVFGAGVILLALAAIRGQSLAVPRQYWPVVAMASAFSMVIWYIAGTYAALLIPSGQAALLGYTMPLWAALGAWLWMGQTLHRPMQAAVALVGVGVGLLTVGRADSYADAPLGFGLGVLAAVSWAAGTLVLKKWPVQASTTVLTGWQLLIGSIPISVGATVWSANASWFIPSWPTMLVIAYITVVPVAIGNAVWLTIVRLLPANVVGLTPVLVPIVAMVSGAVIHGEPLGSVQLAAMTFCAAGLGLVLWNPRTRAHVEPDPASDLPQGDDGRGLFR
jgi:drug/metabolite transporter (DMT)-like permease